MPPPHSPHTPQHLTQPITHHPHYHHVYTPHLQNCHPILWTGQERHTTHYLPKLLWSGSETVCTWHDMTTLPPPSSRQPCPGGVLLCVVTAPSFPPCCSSYLPRQVAYHHHPSLQLPPLDIFIGGDIVHVDFWDPSPHPGLNWTAAACKCSISLFLIPMCDTFHCNVLYVYYLPFFPNIVVTFCSCSSH